MFREIVATSWEGLISELYADDWDSQLRRHRSSYAFRGMVNESWKVETSLMRLGGDFAKLERHLLRNFRKYAHRDVVERNSFWHWLAVAQHHGLPTRLLDWTYSPFVAMHFATDDAGAMNKDGVIWSVEMPEVHNWLPKILQEPLVKEGSYVFTIDMLSQLETDEVVDPLSNVRKGRQAVKNLEDFDDLADDTFAVFMEPPSIDDRIVNQFAIFSALSNAKMTMDDWLSKNTSKSKKVVVPAHLKWEIRDKLDQANINERVIYPGLDGLTKWLKRHYMARLPLQAKDLGSAQNGRFEAS